MKNNYSKGIIAIIFSALGFTGMAFFIKLAGKLPVIQKAVFRNMVTMFFSFILILKAGDKLTIPKKSYGAMFFRCLFGTIGFIANFFAIEYLPLGDAGILQKMAPFFSIIISIFILKEKPDKIAVISILVALLGAAFVIKPSGGIISLPALIGLAGGFCGGASYTFVRRLGLSGIKGNIIIFYFSLSSTIILLPLAMTNYKHMNKGQIILLLLAGICAAVGQTFVTRAYTYAPAKVISIFDYTQVLFAALLGLVFFNEYPDVFSIMGYIIIISTAFTKWYIDTGKSLRK